MDSCPFCSMIPRSHVSSSRSFASVYPSFWFFGFIYSILQHLVVGTDAALPVNTHCGYADYL